MLDNKFLKDRFNYNIYWFIRCEHLKPIISFKLSFVLFIISAHYCNLVIIPYFFNFVINFTNIFKYINNLCLFYLFQVLSFELLFVQFMIFFSTYYKTTAFTGYYISKNIFLNQISFKMINNFQYFVLIIFIYLLLIYCIFSYFCISLVKYNNPNFIFFNSSDISYIESWVNAFSLSNYFGTINIFFPFSILSIVFFSILYVFYLLIAIENSLLCFILRPLRYYIWEVKKDIYVI
jgi:hypothetical protein